MLRQQILARDGETQLHVIIDEAALRKTMSLGMRGQLERLLEVRPPHRLQVIPDAIGPHAAIAGPFTILEFAEVPAVVYVETSGNSLILEEPGEVRQHEDRFTRLRSTPLPPDEPRQFTQRLLDDM